MLSRLLVAAPKNVISRAHISKGDLAVFEKVTGIKKTRRWDGSLSSFIKSALEHISIPRTIGAVIVVTQTPDRLSPCMAVEIHDHLKLPHDVPAFDINHACDGFVMGLYLAKQMRGPVLLICADMLRYNKSPLEGLIFSDAVSIAIVNGEGSSGFKFYTDGSKLDKLYCGMNGEMDMDGNAVFDFVTTKIPPWIKEFWTMADILVPHQANKSMNRVLELRSGFDKRTAYSIEEWGNQSMNSIPFNCYENEEKIMGKNVLLCGFGAGYTAAMAEFRWPDSKICTKVEI